MGEIMITGQAAKTGRFLRAGGEGALFYVVDSRAVRFVVAAGDVCLHLKVTMCKSLIYLIY